MASLAMAFVSCGPSGPPPVLDAAPSDTRAMAVIELAALRAASAYPKLPAIKALAQPLDGVKQLVLAWNGRDLLLLAGGDFAQPPAGYTAIGKGIAAAGPAARIEAARRKLASKTPPPLQVPPGTAEIRAAIRGDGGLPLSGNLENLGIMLRMANPTTLTAHVENSVEVEIAAQCASAEDARELEQSLRGMLTLAAAGTHDPDLESLVRSIQTTRENIVVRVRGIASPDRLAKLLATL